MQRTLWTYEGPPHVGAMRVATAIVPVAAAALRRRIAGHPGLADWTCGRTERIPSSFHKSQAMELERR